MASEIQEWVQNVRVFPYGDPAPTAPQEGEEDTLIALEQEEGDPLLYAWDGVSFGLVGTGPRPHKPVS